MRLKAWGRWLLPVLVLLLLPLVVRDYWLYVVTIGLYYATLAGSWAFLAGYVGQISFAHAALAAVGAYASSLLVIRVGLSPLAAIPLGALTAAVIGLAVGRITLKLKGPYLALTTIAFSELLRIVVTAEAQVTRGSYGLSVPGLFEGTSRVPYYYVMLALTVVALGGLGLVVRSRVGLLLRAIREDETGAAARGVAVARYKVLAFTLSSFVAGLAGGFYAPLVQLVSPQMSTIPEMATILAMAVFGGIESLFGAAVGAMSLELLSEWLRSYPEWRLVVYGVIVLATIRFIPNGIAITAYRTWQSVRRSRATTESIARTERSHGGDLL